MTNPSGKELHSFRSAHRELILEYRFLAELLQFIWKHHRESATPEVMRSDVDDNGYDLIIEWRGRLRHIQLKATVGTPVTVRVSEGLAGKPAGCVVLMTCSEDLSQVHYSWIGSDRMEALDFEGVPKAKHTRADSNGNRRQSISARKVRRSAFERLGGMEELIEKLFPKEVPSFQGEIRRFRVHAARALGSASKKPLASRIPSRDY